MPFQIQADAHIIRTIFSGHLTEAEIGEMARELARVDADSSHMRDRLTDFSAVEHSDFTVETTQHRAESSRTRVYPNNFRSAIVTPQPLHFGLGRMYQTLSDNPQVDLRIFKTRAGCGSVARPEGMTMARCD